MQPTRLKLAVASLYSLHPPVNLPSSAHSTRVHDHRDAAEVGLAGLDVAQYLLAGLDRDGGKIYRWPLYDNVPRFILI